MVKPFPLKLGHCGREIETEWNDLLITDTTQRLELRLHPGGAALRGPGLRSLGGLERLDSIHVFLSPEGSLFVSLPVTA